MSFPHGSWPHKGEEQLSDAAQTVGGSIRRPDNSTQQPYALVGGYSPNDPFRRFPDRTVVRPSSNSPTSSLSGAMGDTHISPNHPTVPSGMAWPIPHGNYTMSEEGFGSFGATPPTPASASPSGAFMYPMHPNPHVYLPGGVDPDHFPPHSSSASSSSLAEQYAMQRAIMHANREMSSVSASPSSPAVPMPLPSNAMAGSLTIGRPPRSSQEAMEEQIMRLQQRVRELETEHESALQRAGQLERELARVRYNSPSAASSSTLPSPLPTPTLPPILEENWRARTEARKKIYCSVNRAGNALCAWHDSRRERRAYPPRNAPPGMLNCGCTHEEALFEESLARHGIGSYHPGESVRMDPTLRNPLLRLLQQRYGYRDGDFDFDPATQTWINGEDAAHWQSRLASGAANVKKNRPEERR
ncbi:uncharacterized protein LAESUDRAFT_423333 [Laetiporus sulphureus 93-53]|uniref:Uncharacterized protein n=1 Tax=Laetiporus sulphureus 93-53 TaxID=1314785 RepID=A0A165GIB7_9APHY|nr:uncharacterized protein LAESUDRAFT_423333 [Laetiporus sulphureus 93-53]KZT10387.1 hypothetical protein LAESUDRAFT_423333 [Laetiporus sulphureus 93-53]